MEVTFNTALRVVLANEGGYVNDSDDPGGETNYGISKRAFPNIDIKNLTVEEAGSIYFNKYWLPLKCEAIKNGLLKYHLFDMGVNSGIVRAAKLLQDLVNVKQDGIIGGETIKAVNEFPDQKQLSACYAELRKEYYQNLTKRNPKNIKYLKGWLRRVDSIKV